MFEIIHGEAPRHRPTLEKLRGEHRVMLDDLAGLLRRAGGEPARETLIGEVTRLTEQIHEHEQRESELWIDALSTDLGGGD